MGSGRADEIVQVSVHTVVYQSDDGRFSVVRGVSGPLDEPITVVGDLGEVTAGETLRVQGKYTHHPVHGTRFRAESFTPLMPTTRTGMIRYLGSGLVSGLGPALAERLVARFGEHTLDVISTQSARLREVPGIGKKRATSIAEALRARRAEAETFAFLQGLGIGPAIAKRMLKRYGNRTAAVVRSDPYLLAEEIRGLGFASADRIGRALGIPDDDPRRAAGAILHVLARGADDGHVFLMRQDVIDATSLLSVPVPQTEAALTQLTSRGLVVDEAGAIYPPPLHRAERQVASDLRRLAGAAPSGAGDTGGTSPPSHETTLTPTQRDAVWASLHHRLLILTGGPGTGKTTTVRAMVRAHEARKRRVQLLAPTGRASKRLAEATGRTAQTIHRALEWNPRAAAFGRNQEHPLEADLVLVDEASMVDVLLASKLLAAIASTASLVLVGDVDQLPPIGPGRVLRELLASDVAHVVRLQEVFRQAQQSWIVRGAHAILRGQTPEPTPAGATAQGDLHLVRVRDSEAVGARVVTLLDRIAAAYNLDPKRDVQVLAPMRRGPTGTEQLNLLLQSALNPAADGAEGVLRPGDKVMQLRNDYDLEVYNGDVGVVRGVDANATHVEIDGRLVTYENEARDALTLAYACTVHKVQGSEFPAVVVVLHRGHHMLLTRALFYTAVTRARTLVVLVGDENAMRRAARNAVSASTNSRLLHRLKSPDDER